MPCLSSMVGKCSCRLPALQIPVAECSLDNEEAPPSSFLPLFFVSKVFAASIGSAHDTQMSVSGISRLLAPNAFCAKCRAHIHAVAAALHYSLGERQHTQNEGRRRHATRIIFLLQVRQLPPPPRMPFCCWAENGIHAKPIMPALPVV